MNSTVHIILLIYSATIAVNFFTSSVLWIIHKHVLFAYLTFLWIFSGINFFLQGWFLNSDLKMLISFSTYILASITLHRLTVFLLSMRYYGIGIYIIAIGFVGIGAALLAVGSSYQSAAIFVSIGISLPMLNASFLAYTRSQSKGFGILSVLLALNGLHFLDYPFLRESETGAIFGFSLALFLIFSFSIFFPSFLLLEISSQYTIRLENEVDQRTRALVDLDNRNRTLISILCHDLATPITSALFKVRKAKREIVGHDELLQKIEGLIRSISSTIEKVRELQAVTLGKRQIALKECDPKVAISEVIRDYSEEISLKRIEINIEDCRSKTVAIMADAALLRHQVLANILSNAIKFSKEGAKIVFRIREDSQFICIDIIDFGAGISQDRQEKLFSFTAPTSVSGLNQPKGTGFGLPLAYSCIQMMKGTVEIKSQYFDVDLNSTVGTNFILKFQKSSQPIYQLPTLDQV